MAKSPDNRERHVPVVTARVISLSQIRMRFGTGSPLGPLTVGPATQPAPTSVRRSAPPHARRPALARSRPSGRSMTPASAARRQQRLLPLLFYLSISSLSMRLHLPLSVSVSVSVSLSPSGSSRPRARVRRSAPGRRWGRCRGRWGRLGTGSPGGRPSPSPHPSPTGRSAASEAGLARMGRGGSRGAGRGGAGRQTLVGAVGVAGPTERAEAEGRGRGRGCVEREVKLHVGPVRCRHGTLPRPPVRPARTRQRILVIFTGIIRI